MELVGLGFIITLLPTFAFADACSVLVVVVLAGVVAFLV